MKKLFTYLIIALFSVVAVIAAQRTSYVDNYYSGHSLYNISNITANRTDTVLWWTNISQWPSKCVGNSAVTALNDTVTCTDAWVDTTGDTLDGKFNVTGNVTLGTSDIILIYGTIMKQTSSPAVAGTQ